MTIEHQFKPIHGHSKKPLYKRWYDLKKYAAAHNIEWLLGDYLSYMEKIPSGYSEESKLVRIDRSLGYAEGNLMWIPKRAIKSAINKRKQLKKKRKRKRNPILIQSDISEGWKGF